MEVKWRKPDELREIKITRNYLKDPEGSCLFQMGNTMVLCTATVLDKVPNFLKGTGEGWVTAEYALLPRSTPERNIRESRLGRPDSRAIEISRLIGRALRGAIDLKKLGEHTIIIDCDVLQADGGTRTASINGGFLALYDATRFMLKRGMIEEDPIIEFIGAVSVGIVEGDIILDLSYEEDSKADVDLNIVLTESGKIIEIQGTGEKRTFTKEELNRMLDIAYKGISKIIALMKKELEPR